ncbi:MAG: hypothetical protein CL920_34610 [Deltaproteobacteria bacterium]|nr:hypothetical protein [Deltaproteobacteria bacterium]MBU53858.1 hypothetical protein [Deltaproteobacteria bacterium]|tara:strand:- start:4935 stop:6068 length:1134 start_codon:yes stop_codon:yes gene_type:complete
MTQSKDHRDSNPSLQLQISDENGNDNDIIVLSKSKAPIKPATRKPRNEDKITQELPKIGGRPLGIAPDVSGLLKSEMNDDGEPVLLLGAKGKQPPPPPIILDNRPQDVMTLEFPSEPQTEPVLVLGPKDSKPSPNKKELEDVPWTQAPTDPASSLEITLQRAPSLDDLPATGDIGSVKVSRFETPFDGHTAQDTDTPFKAHTPAKQEQEIKVGMLAPGATREDERPSDQVILDGLLQELTRHCSRACCFLIRGGLIIGFAAHGDDDIAGRVRELLFPLDAPSVFAEVVRTRAAYKGSLPDTAMDQIVGACLGEQLPKKIAIFPVVQGEQVMTLFYMDDAETGRFPEDMTHIEQMMLRATLLEIHWQPPGLEELLNTV